MYTAFALLIEDSRGREVLPIGAAGRGPGGHPWHPGC
jgi:hypothetical protein